MDEMKDVSDDGDSSMLNASAMDVSDPNPDASINYQTADEDNSRYFSVIESESTLEDIEPDQSTITMDVTHDKTALTVQSEQSVPIGNVEPIDDKSTQIEEEQVSKFNVHENMDDSTTIVDIFDDNESSVDGHDLVIDDDPQPSVKSDDCQESADAQYKYEQDNVITIKDANFSMLKKNHFANELLDAIENTNASHGADSCKVDIKELFGDSEENGLKGESYNFPEGSHRVTLQLDGKDMEAINIGQDIYIYENEGALTAFQVMKEDGNSKIKYLNITKNDDGNIELYEEQVSQVPVTNEDSVETIEKNKSNISDGNLEQLKVPEVEKNSHRVIQAINNQGKKSPLIENVNNVSPLKILDLPSVDCKKVVDEPDVLKAGIKTDDDNIAEKLLGELHNGDILESSKDIEKIDDLQKELVSIMDGDGDNIEKDDKITLYASRDSDKTEMVKLKKLDDDSANWQLAKGDDDKVIPQSVDIYIYDSEDDESSVIEGEPVTGDCELEWNMKDVKSTDKVSESDVKMAPVVQQQLNEQVNEVESKEADSIVVIEEETSFEDIDTFEPVVNRNVNVVKTYSKESKLKRDINQINPQSEDCGTTVLATNADISIGNGIESEPKKDSSPSIKNRQPRKQIFTPVATSDIELIFLNNKTNKQSELSEESAIKSPLKLKDELSSSDRRKRGRPKRIITESTLVEVKPTEEQSVSATPLISTDCKSSNNKENDLALIQNTDAGTDKQITEIVDDNVEENVVENVSVPSTSGKRKKGRPKKILSASYCSDVKEVKVDEPRKSLPVMLRSSSMNSELKVEDDENVCPLCNKNFRSKNVLFKHAKHCCGLTEIVKSPKRKKIGIDCNDVNIEEVSEGLIYKDKIKERDMKLDTHEQLLDKDKCKVDEEKIEDTHERLLDDVKLDESLELKEDGEKVEDSLQLLSKEKIKGREIKLDDRQLCLDKVESETDKEKVVDSRSSLDIICKEKLEASIKEIRKEKVEHPRQESLLKVHKVETKQMKQCKVESKMDVKASPMTRLSRIMKAKAPLIQVIKCEICGKTFRQLAHKVNHQRSHTKEKLIKKEEVESSSKTKDGDDSGGILKCEVCQKGFRKLHHLVAHREVHIELKSQFVSPSSRSNESEAGFRCEICDKSFRKMHHLVEHRQLHAAEAASNAETKLLNAMEEENAICNGNGKPFRKRHLNTEQRDVHYSPSKIKKEVPDANVRLSITSVNSDDSNNCSICGKSYRKLHHLVEHRESHAESSTANTDSKSLHDRLNTKDIIHECSKCYMVFPNINSLNKHTTKCLNRKLARKTVVSGEVQDKPHSLTIKRKSVDSTTKESTVKRVNKEVKSNVNLRKSISKVPVKSTTKTPSLTNVKKVKLDIKEEKMNEMSKESDDENVRYSLNPEYEPSLNRSEEHADDTPKGGESSASEDENIRYSFPINAIHQEASKSINKATTSSLKLSKKQVGAPKKSNIPTEATPKKTMLPKRDTRSSGATLLVKRASLGGRKSLEGRKLTAPKKLDLRCCGKLFQSQALLATHRKLHKVARKVHKCDCGKQFENEILLKRHMDTEHTPPKSYKCQHCDASLRTAAQYANHKKSHGTTAAAVHQPIKAKRKSLRGGEAVVAAPTSTTVKRVRRIAHGGVPLSEKMKKALANAKF